MKAKFISLLAVAGVLTLSAVSLAKPVFAESSAASADCGNIDATDQDTSDWAGMPFLVQDSGSDVAAGITYYWDATANTWATTAPADYRYTMQPDKWIDIKAMKQCNTPENFKLYLKTAVPMMTYYDKTLNQYFRLHTPTADGTQLTMPVDWEHWMVWKFQALNDSNSQDIFYFAADISLSQGNAGQGGGTHVYLVRESTAGQTFEEATFNPTAFSSDGGGFTGDADTLIEELSGGDGKSDKSLKEDGSGSGDGSGGHHHEGAQTVEFEVSQALGDFFKVTGFHYDEIVKEAAQTYSSKGDTTKTVKYRFSAVGPKQTTVTNITVTGATVTWQALKNAKVYQVIVLDSNNKPINKIKGVTDTTVQLTDLQASTTYKVRVRAKYIKGRNSNWSDVADFTTLSQ